VASTGGTPLEKRDRGLDWVIKEGNRENSEVIQRGRAMVKNADPKKEIRDIQQTVIKRGRPIGARNWPTNVCGWDGMALIAVVLAIGSAPAGKHQSGDEWRMSEQPVKTGSANWCSVLTDEATGWRRSGDSGA